MATHQFHMPIGVDDVRSLHIGDHVVLQDTLFGIRDATLIHMFDHGRETRLDLEGHAVIHTAPNVKKVPVSNECPAGYESICIGTTTSMRMERFTRPLMEKTGVRVIVGKGGLGKDSAESVPGPRRRVSRDHRAAQRRWRRRGSSESSTSTWTISTPKAYGSSESRISGRSWSRWIRIAAACLTPSATGPRSGAPRRWRGWASTVNTSRIAPGISPTCTPRRRGRCYDRQRCGMSD